MSDYSKLKELAEAFPDYDYDSNETPFFNGPSGESLGGESTGFYCVYGPDFEVGGEQYDGVTLVEATTLAQAKFICEAKATVLGLIAENERLTGFVVRRREQADQYDEALTKIADQRDQLKVDLQIADAACFLSIAENKKLKFERDTLKAECEGLRAALTSSSEFLMHDAKVRRMLDGAGRISPMFPLRRLVMEQIEVALSGGEQS